MRGGERKGEERRGSLSTGSRPDRGKERRGECSALFCSPLVAEVVAVEAAGRHDQREEGKGGEERLFFFISSLPRSLLCRRDDAVVGPGQDGQGGERRGEGGEGERKRREKKIINLSLTVRGDGTEGRTGGGEKGGGRRKGRGHFLLNFYYYRPLFL